MSSRIVSSALSLTALVALSSAQADTRKNLELLGTFRFLSDAPLEKIQGTAEGARGVIVTDLANLAKTSGRITVAVAHLNTGSPIRDQHLRGESWLHASRHPELSFRVRDVAGVRARQLGAIFVATGRVRGDFTLRGVTKPVTSAFTLKVKGDRVKVELSFDVALADYAILGRDGIIGKKVGERIAIKGRLVGRATDGTTP